MEHNNEPWEKDLHGTEATTVELEKPVAHPGHPHRTLFTLIKDPSLIEVIVEATQAVIGDLDNKDTGVLFVVPVNQVYGLRKVGGKENA